MQEIWYSGAFALYMGQAVNAQTLRAMVIILTSYSGSCLVFHVMDSKKNMKLSLSMP
jgi:hypothetical protein